MLQILTPVYLAVCSVRGCTVSEGWWGAPLAGYPFSPERRLVTIFTEPTCSLCLQASSLTVLKPQGPKGPAVCGSFPELILLDLLAVVDTVACPPWSLSTLSSVTLHSLLCLWASGLGALFSFRNILFPTPSSCSPQMQSASQGGDS